MKAVIFTGPSLSKEEAKLIFENATYLPPIKRGDAEKALERGAKIIGIIDGVFHQDVAISPREIFEVLKKGVIVVGGSSMGALRAAELDEFGMIGVGKIYEMYKSGEIESDDEVALIFNPLTLEPLSEPLINIRLTFKRILENKLIDKKTIDSLFDIAKELYFPKRNYNTILEIAVKRNIIDEITANKVYSIIQKNKIDQKRLDAIEVVKTVKRIYCLKINL
ncbi:MAG: TfuA-related McrA-glycine thioamidation protein [Thermoproteota archaeon]|jgi:hypothetical protein|uniref:TfuA-related McrA-glycine thioamidation protein n=1 Tax=Candidatus Methanodesulfokora washburnensis TaxID=2478471 RepID=A0A3R9PGF2_9CREN|nr:TfuA-related McrA-glycine thioamidation protein [Candidatus Methanodesulfokores washburnensis]RSN72799.1 TfuA-related McrA-glycine thioamidation protein [Candidatus Methanodesulfokores washburnensis]RZN62170.1 MAG: TfuA-related McrA-glycine thioamidation protein [Candidatus Methanodesulfokores washburnensis]TDA40597.1 MAG: TfuA-related McrA-glycine thioamidation protein [Candidatus Korarchaeota archaeon]